MNVLTINVKILERSHIRYNYTGVPILEMTLQHFSKVLEDKFERDVSFNIKSVAVGDLAIILDKVPCEKKFIATGFLAKYYKDSMLLRFHLQKISNSIG